MRDLSFYVMLKAVAHVFNISFHITTFYNSARRSQKRSDLFTWVPVRVKGTIKALQAAA